MADLSSLDAAANRLTQPDVTAAELAQIAGAHPALRPLVANHPAAYPELRAWIQAASAAPSPTPTVQTPATTPAAQSAIAAPRTDAPVATATGRRAVVPWTVAGLAVVVAAGSWLWPHPGAAAATSGAPSAGTSASASASPAATAAAGSAVAGLFGASEGNFATPEAALTFVVQHIAAGDVQGAAPAFASTSMVNGFNFVTQVQRLNAMVPSEWLPSTSAYNRTVDMGLRTSLVTADLRWMMRSIVDPQDAPNDTVTIDSEAAATALAARLDGSKMSQLSVVHLDKLGVTHTAMTRNFPAMAAPYGADEYAEYAVLYDTINGPMSGGVRFLRYGNRWLIMDLSSALLGTTGELTPSSEADYATTLAQAN